MKFCQLYWEGSASIFVRLKDEMCWMVGIDICSKKMIVKEQKWRDGVTFRVKVKGDRLALTTTDA